MADTNFFLGVQMIAIPAGLRRVKAQWIAKLSICMRPRVYGPPGSYVLLKDVHGFTGLPARLRSMTLKLKTGPGPEIDLEKPPANGFNPALWRWDEQSFAEALPVPAVVLDRIAEALKGMPHYFPAPVEPLFFLRQAVLDALVGSGGGLYTAATWYSMMPAGVKPSARSNVDPLALMKIWTLKEFSDTQLPIVPPKDILDRYLRLIGGTPKKESDLIRFLYLHSIGEGPRSWTKEKDVKATSTEIQVKETENGRFVEIADKDGAVVKLPDEGKIQSGFGITACNRLGSLQIETSSGRPVLRQIPLGLASAIGSASIAIPTDKAYRLRWNGTHWNAMPETVDNEFHRCVCALDQYPEAARNVGLTWDVEVKLTDDQATSLAAGGTLELVGAPTDDSLGVVPLRLRTKYVASTSELAPGLRAFAPASRNTANAERHADGFLELSNATIAQIDLDMPTLTIITRLAGWQAESMPNRGPSPLSVDTDRAKLKDKSYAPEDTRDALPALHEIGLEISSSDWATSHKAAAERSNTLHAAAIQTAARARSGPSPLNASQAASNEDDVLYLEDLLLGYRYDVIDTAKGEWKSLMVRSGAIVSAWTDSKVVDIVSEGVITPGEAGESTEAESGLRVLRSTSVGFRWTGWSPILSKPFTREKKDVKPSARGLGLNAKLTIPAGKQPKLRYGQTYRFRARITDTAGNSWSLDDANEILMSTQRVARAAQTRAERALRFRPVSHPVIAERIDGEAREVRALVLRSFDHGGAKDATYEIYAPRIPFETMHLLGAVDKFAKVSECTQFLKQTEARAKAHDIRIERATEIDPATPPAQAGELRKGKLKVDYLTLEDPDTDAVAWAHLPGKEATKGIPVGSPAPGLHFSQALDCDPKKLVFSVYPAAKHPNGKSYANGPIKVRLRSGKKRESKESGDRLDIWLPPGESQEIQIGARLSKDSLDHFALYHAALAMNNSPDAKASLAAAMVALTAAAQGDTEIEEAKKLPETALNQLMAYPSQGRCPTITPMHSLRIVHAVQRPIGKPEIKEYADGNDPTVVREYGKADVEIRIRLHGHISSIGKVGFIADWDEKDDIPGRRRWQMARKTEQAYEAAVPEPDERFSADRRVHYDLKVVHKLSDTRHRKIRYTAQAVSRYVDFFDRKVKGEISEDEHAKGMQGAPSGKPLSPEDFIRSSEPLLVNIPSSQEPDSIEVEYIVPKIRQKEERDSKGNVTAEETTPELRVYFRRPWYSSGEDERLGVVLWHNGAGPDPVADAWTAMAEDPLAFSKPVSTAEHKLSASFFSGPKEAIRIVERQPIQSADRDPARQKVLGARTAAVIGYEVHEMSGEDILYADIPIGPTHRDMPFLRFAFVRYQPNSIKGAHISNSPGLVYVRPFAERAVTVRMERISSNPFSNRRKMTIRVSGPAGADASTGVVDSQLRLTLSGQTADGVYEADGEVKTIDGKWISETDRTAIWEYSAEIRLLVPDTGDSGPGVATNTIALLELLPRSKQNLISWFTQLELGTITW